MSLPGRHVRSSAWRPSLLTDGLPHGTSWGSPFVAARTCASGSLHTMYPPSLRMRVPAMKFFLRSLRSVTDAAGTRRSVASSMPVQHRTLPMRERVPLVAACSDSVALRQHLVKA